MTRTHTTARWACLLVVLSLVACGGDTGHEHDGEAADHDHDAAPTERPARVETLWTDAHEWFVEHPLLVMGETAEIAAHLTKLDDFRPVETGRLQVSLLDPAGNVRQRAIADAVARSGIFLPQITPEAAGDGRLVFAYTAPSGQVDEVAWQVAVVASPDQLGDAPSEPEGIAFLKEQQWRIPFATMELESRELRESIELPASIETHPRGTALVAASATGTFRAPDSGLATPGARVTAGQVLGHLEPLPESTEGWHTLHAQLVEARNRVATAERERARATRLVEAGAIPERRLAEAETALDNARARLRATELRAGSLEAAGDADSLPLRSPIAGVVAEVRITDGEPVDPERSLFRIVDLGRLVARVEVPEPELQRLLAARRQGIEVELALRPGGGGSAAAAADSATTSSPADAWITGGRLLELGTMVDPSTRVAPVRYELRPADDRLRPGMSAVAQLAMGSPSPALAVPASAIIDLAGVQVVYVQLGGETFEERTVRTATRDGDWLEVVSGLAPGDRVVTRGAYEIRLASLSPDAAPAHSH